MRRAIDRLREVSGRPRLRRLASSLLAMALAGCGGGNEAEPRARAFVAAMATATDTAPALADNRAQRLAATIAPVIFTADDWFAWAERTYPELFPAGPQTQTVFFLYRNYQVRYYPQQDVHLGVSADGHVYALGAFTQQELVQYGQLANYACITNPASCLGSVEDTVSVWNWAGTEQCKPNEFPQRLEALRQQLLGKGFAATGGLCAWTMEYGMPAMCGALDGRMAVLNVPRSQFAQVLGEGWRPFLNGVNGDLNHPVLTPCDRWPPAQ